MAQKPIGYYGEFRPTSIDTSAARRLEAIAGLAGQVGDIAADFGKKKVAEQAFLKEKNDIVAAEKEGMIAGNASAISKTSPELTVYEDVRTFEADRTRNAAVMAAFNAGTQNEITKMVSRLASENPADISAFEELTQSGLNGLISEAPEELKPAFEVYFNQVSKTYGSNIYKAQKKQQNEIADAELKTAVTDQETNISNLARSLDTVELNKASLIYLETTREGLANGLLKGGEFATGLANLKDTIATQSALGRFDLIIRNEDQTVEQRIASGQNVIDQINEKDTFQVEDPLDPEKMITLDADEKDALVKDLESELKDFESEEIKKAESEIQASRFTQISNYSSAMEAVQDVSISDDDKLFAIAESEMKKSIGREEAVLLRRYVNSAKALNAITNSEVMGDIVARAYDLNADFDMDANSNNYLQGVNNLREDILIARSRGDLTSDDELKLNNQLKTLTAAKIAGATSEIANANSRADRTIKESLQPDLWGVARRDLLDAVRLRKQEIEDEGRTVSRREEINLWSELAPSVVAGIQEKRRGESIERVNRILTIPTVTTQAEFDALPAGAKFIENGVQYEKP
mgnify:CR=1 FL=1